MARIRSTRTRRARVRLPLLALIIAVGCEASTETPSTGSPTVSSVSGSPSQEPGEELDVQTVALTGEDQLFHLLRDLGWTRVLVPPEAEPTQLQLWTGDGHWHARIEYVLRDSSVTLIQAETQGLPPGRLVSLRGLDGVRSDGALYWNERGFTFSLKPGEKELAARLEWVSLTDND